MNKSLRILFIIFFSIFGGLVGYRVARFTETFLHELSKKTQIMNMLGLIILGILIGIALAYPISKLFTTLMTGVISTLLKFTLQEISVCSMGLIFGLLIATLINLALYAIPFSNIPLIGDYLGPFLMVVITIFWGYLGIFFAFKRLKAEKAHPLFSFSGKELLTQKQMNFKILDTCTIIDGRIIDIVKSGFVDGDLIVPSFILTEIQQIADSADDLKRAKGRRALDMLDRMLKDINLNIYDKDFPEKPVDEKLVALAGEINAQIITTDFNLNKIAKIHKIKVLNINELANAVKLNIIAGEELSIQILKRGKEQNQGVGYLPDGTMVVVEEGINYVGKTIRVQISSVLQTSAGKIIFGKPI